jgi:AAA family ATP:ADP antiporter
MESAMPRRLRRLLELRAGEGSSVLLTFLLIATVVASFVLARAVRNGLFLSQFDAHRLVYVYVAVPLVLLVFAPVHTWIAERSGQRAVITGTLLFFVANVLTFWVLFRLDPRPVLAALFYVWVNCYGIIASFQAWSFATSVFDARQAKRLFGLIGSGAPAGAIVGGLLARTLVGPLGAVDLLLVLAALVGLAALFVTASLRVIPRRPPSRQELRPSRLLPETLRLVSRSSYLRGIAALVFLVAIVTQWTQFQFLLVVQDRFARDADRVTAFLGEWNVYFGIVAFLVQVLLTGPALRRFGIAITILLLPGALGLGSALVLFVPVFWSVLLLSSFDQSLRFSIDKATFELLYLPLPAAVRSGVKATIDMVFSRAADAAGGLLLGFATQGFTLGLLTLPGAGLGLRGLAALNLGLIMAWVFVALATRRGYVNSIRESLKGHRLEADTSMFGLDRSTVDLLTPNLDTGDEAQLLNTLGLLERHYRRAAHPALRSLLDHPSAAVRRRALAVLNTASDRSVIPRVAEMLHDEDLEVRTEALAYLTQHAAIDPLAAIRELGDFPDASVRAGMVTFLARPGRTQNLEAARVLLDAMVEDALPEGRPVRLEAARLAAVLPQGFGRAIGRLLRDPDVEVARQAMRAVGRKQRPEFVPELLAGLAHPELADDAARSLASLGDGVVEALRKRLDSGPDDIALEVKREIPTVLVRIGTPAAQRVLMESLLQGDPTVRRRVIASLNRLRRRHPELSVDAALVETVLAAEITGHYRSQQILAHLSRELRPDEPALSALSHAMEEELERIFGLLALLGPGEDLLSAHRALLSSDAPARANALELLDNVLKGPLRRLIVPLVDSHVTVEERAALGARTIGVSLDTREEAVATLAGCSDAWLRSCAARIIGTLGLRSFQPQLDRWRDDADPLLREAARAARVELRQGPAANGEPTPTASWGASSDGLGVG